ncbi:hypothetical protein [uncultured Brachyspira sp.]|uniref:hypothetical protein n=1 Tax=uncultured Brachyspira sp. TaxID=221953 RepID=UPI0025DEFDE9|nr:hypothetical protein [uncultured Brachyspira sp.]
MKRIYFIFLLILIFLSSCNMYISDKVSILMFDEDAKGNMLTNEMLNFILVKREDTNSLNKLTYIYGTIDNKKGNQVIKNIEEAKYIEDIKNTNNIIDLNFDNTKMTINYSKEKILFTDTNGIEYILNLNNSEDTWFYKLISE